MRPVLALVQGAFFFINGIWPLVHVGSFMAVTGLKTDIWLVKTVGFLITAIGAALLVAAQERKVDRSIGLLGILSALFLAVIDVYYVTNGTIRPIYLLDAAIESVFMCGWLGIGWSALRTRSSRSV